MTALVEQLPLGYPLAVVTLGSAVLGFVAGALGPFAVLRGRSMGGDVLSHGTLPGVVVAFALIGTKTSAVVLVGAAASALLAAILVIGIERFGRTPPDAALGVVLSGSFALGVVLLTYVGSSGNADQAGLEGYLFGQAAGMVAADVSLTAGVGVVVLAMVAVAFRVLRTGLFDPGFAAVAGIPSRAVDLGATLLVLVAVVLGVRIVGVILMVALLVAPTVAARQCTRRLATLVVLAGGIGAACGALGALVAAVGGLPTGPVIVLLATAAAGVALLVASRVRAAGVGARP